LKQKLVGFMVETILFTGPGFVERITTNRIKGLENALIQIANANVIRTIK
jgi:hypothetical protein